MIRIQSVERKKERGRRRPGFLIVAKFSLRVCYFVVIPLRFQMRLARCDSQQWSDNVATNIASRRKNRVFLKNSVEISSRGYSDTRDDAMTAITVKVTHHARDVIGADQPRSRIEIYMYNLFLLSRKNKDKKSPTWGDELSQIIIAGTNIICLWNIKFTLGSIFLSLTSRTLESSTNWIFWNVYIKIFP